MHLRSPSVAAGVSAFWWALLFALYVWGFLLAVGNSNAMAFIVGALTFGGVFLFIRSRGAQGRLRLRSRSLPPALPLPLKLYNRRRRMSNVSDHSSERNSSSVRNASFRNTCGTTPT